MPKGQMYCDTCSCSVTSDSLQPHGLKLTKLPCPRDFSGKDTGVGCRFLLQGDLPYPGIEPACPALAGRFFTTEPPGKPSVTPTHVQVDPGPGCLHSFGPDSCYLNSHPQRSITTLSLFMILNVARIFFFQKVDSSDSTWGLLASIFPFLAFVPLYSAHCECF